MNPTPSTASKLARAFTFGISDTPGGRMVLRRVAGLCLRSTLRLRSRPLAPAKVGSVLVVAPHPDDESFGCGGTLNQLIVHGADVHMAVVTDGSGSHPAHPTVPPGEIAQRRADEARAAAAALGLSWQRVAFLGVRDGSLGQQGEPEARILEAAIGDILRRTKPDAVLLPCRNDGSTEHEATFARVDRALRDSRVDARLLEFPVWSWWNPKLLLKAALSCPTVWRSDVRAALPLKRSAIDCYASQTLPIPPQEDPALPRGFASMFLGGSEFFFEWRATGIRSRA